MHGPLHNMCHQNVNGYHTGYGTFKMELGAMSDKRTTTPDHNVDDRKMMLLVNKIFRFTILNHLRGMSYVISASLDGVCHSLLTSIYRFVPPVIHFPVFAVMNGNSDACFRPLPVNLIIEKNFTF